MNDDLKELDAATEKALRDWPELFRATFTGIPDVRYIPAPRAAPRG